MEWKWKVPSQPEVESSVDASGRDAVYEAAFVSGECALAEAAQAIAEALQPPAPEAVVCDVEACARELADGVYEYAPQIEAGVVAFQDILRKHFRPAPTLTEKERERVEWRRESAEQQGELILFKLLDRAYPQGDA